MINANLKTIYLVLEYYLFALRGLSSPDTSRQGNYFGIAGMTIAMLHSYQFFYIISL